MALLRRDKNLEHFLILATEAMKREKLKKNTLTCTRKETNIEDTDIFEKGNSKWRN